MIDFDVYSVAKKLIGPIEPVGETNTDVQRLKNIRVMTSLIESLLYDINEVRHNKDSHEHSVKEIGKHADGFWRYLAKEYNIGDKP